MKGKNLTLCTNSVNHYVDFKIFMNKYFSQGKMTYTGRILDPLVPH